MEDTERQIEQFLYPFNQKLQALAQELRQFLKNETKPTYELVGDSTISLNIGYGFTKKAWDCYCAIIVYSKHINLSFPSGAFLNDPKKLLQGTGKRIRHIKIMGINDVEQHDIKNLVIEARNKALEEAKENDGEEKPVQTIIKPVSGVKKRPK